MCWISFVEASCRPCGSPTGEAGAARAGPALPVGWGRFDAAAGFAVGELGVQEVAGAEGGGGADEAAGGVEGDREAAEEGGFGPEGAQQAGEPGQAFLAEAEGFFGAAPEGGGGLGQTFGAAREFERPVP